MEKEISDHADLVSVSRFQILDDIYIQKTWNKFKK